ncbi:MAG: MoaD/ThiS family protein [Bacillota bacterium]
MKVLVRLHGYIASECGVDSLELDGLRGDECVKDILAMVRRRLKSPEDELGSLEPLVTINFLIASPNAKLKEGDVVDILPPAVGG